MKIWLIQNPVQVNRIFFISLIIFLIVSNGYAQQDAIDVHPAVQSSIEAKPGTIVAVTFKVTNLTSDQQTCIGAIVLPQAWKPVTREFPFELKSGESDVRLTTFAIPSDAPADKYRIQYIVHDQAASVHKSDAFIGVVVSRVTQLELQLYSAPRFIVAGTIFSTDILVTNQGNSRGIIRLTGRSSYNYHVRLDSVYVHLEPKETRQMRLFITTDAKANRISHTLEVEATSLQDTTVQERISSVVEIIPRETKVGTEYFEFPIVITAREAGQNGRAAPQVDIAGVGSLDEKRTDRLEFLFRVGQTQTISSLGQRDEYHLSYSRKYFELNLGDQNYSLSTLTEAGRFAEGVGGRATIGKISAGGFFNETRWLFPRQKETGGFFSYNALKDATLSLNYLSKREQFSSDMVSLEGLFTPLTGSKLDLEYGTGVKDGKHDDAYAVHLEGSRPWIAYDLRYIKAGPNYGGYYRDINFLSSSVNVQPIKDVRIEANIVQQNTNLARDTNQIYAPMDNSYQVGIGYSNYVSVYVLSNLQADQFDSSKYRNRDNAIRATAGYNFSFATVTANFDYGTTRNELLNKESPTQSLTLNVSFSPAAQQNYSTTFEYSKYRDIYSGGNQERLSAGLNGWILFGQSTYAQFNMYGSRILASIMQTYSIFEASLDHVFPFSHKLTFHGRYTIITPVIMNNQFAYVLEYSIPLGVPIKRISGIGQLSGSIIDEQGKGLANVLVSIGSNAALSDKQGHFYFSSLQPGSNFVLADMVSIGFDRITKQPMPMEVIIRGGEETKIVLSVTRSATISGNVILFGTAGHEFGDTSTAVVELGGKSSVFLEISNGTEINRRVSDSHGRFMFADLRPGNWVLKVIGGDIPENYIIDPEEIKIDLPPGEKKDVKIQLRPRKRTIKMLQVGKLIQETPPIIAKEEVIPPPPLLTVKAEKPCIVISHITKKEYVLQISSWTTKSKARRVAKKLHKFPGLRAYVMAARVRSLGLRYRVFIGVFKTREAAMDFCYQFNFE